MNFLKEILLNKHAIYSLVKRDFSSRYSGSTLGILWAILQPVIMMIIMWAVFSFGLKAPQNYDGIPYIPWLFTGMIAWNYLSEAFVQTSNAIVDYSFLVKKVNFNLKILPIVKIISSSILHGVFIAIVIAVLFVNKIFPTWGWFQLPYYYLCAVVFLVSTGMLLSSIMVITRDVGHIVGIFLQLGFWGTPIVWNINSIPEKYHLYFKINPAFYIIEGYRNSLLYNTPFYSDLTGTLIFWLTTTIMGYTGFKVFNNLRTQFADLI